MRARPAINLFIVGLFAAAILLPLASWLDGIETQVGEDENRGAAAFPEFAWSKRVLRKFPAGFDAWFEDRQGFRRELLTVYDRITEGLLDSHDTVLEGRDGWLFLLREPTATEARVPIVGDLCGRNPMPAPALAAWVDALVENRRRLAARGIEYLVTFAPNKQTIYSDKMPGRVRCTPGRTRLDQLTAALERRGETGLLDLRPPLRSTRGESNPLWYRTDTHWNGLGASIALATILDALNDRRGFGLAAALDGPNYRLSPVASAGLGLARMLGRSDELVENEPRIVVIDSRVRRLPNPFPNRDPNPMRQPEAYTGGPAGAPSVLVLHDSFFHDRLKQLTAESFSVAVFVWHWGRPSLRSEDSLIDAVRPDVVIHEMVERNLLHPYFADRTAAGPE